MRFPKQSTKLQTTWLKELEKTSEEATGRVRN
jgi:hypothetical protein